MLEEKIPIPTKSHKGLYIAVSGKLQGARNSQIKRDEEMTGKRKSHIYLFYLQFYRRQEDKDSGTNHQESP